MVYVINIFFNLSVDLYSVDILNSLQQITACLHQHYLFHYINISKY